MYINTVGTFGISSASYYWSRCGQFFGSTFTVHLSSYCTYMTSSSCRRFPPRSGWCRVSRSTHDLLCPVPCGRCPAIVVEDRRWGHCHMGRFEILHRTFCLGVSERRAEWFVKWSETVARCRLYHYGLLQDCSCGRGAPVRTPHFFHLHLRGPTRRVPAYVSFILRYLASQLRRQRHYTCESIVLHPENAPRVDAQASLARTGIGGLATGQRQGWKH